MAWHDALTKKHQTRRRADKEPREAKPNKYKAVRTASGFPSQLEETHYADLLYREKAGLVRDVKRYPSIELMPGLRWKPDFGLYDLKLGQYVIEESKGVEGERFAVIKQVWRCIGPHLLRIYKGTTTRVSCVEEIPAGKYRLTEK